MSLAINVLFLAAEGEPFIKVGGLADVAGSLPLALRALPVKANGGALLDVRLVLPLHKTLCVEESSLRPVAEFAVARDGGHIQAQAFEMISAGMPVYFIKSEPLSTPPSVYSLNQSSDREKYCFFSLAALELFLHLDWHPVIVHANDWHTALALYAIRSGLFDSYSPSPRTVITIHNLAYMGGDGSDVLSGYGFNSLKDDNLPEWAHTQPLPLGLWSADAIVPVSPTYAKEILTPDFGCGLDSYLNTRKNNMTGILNGLDINFWDPGKDRALSACYDADDLSPRAINKASLQKSLGLKEDNSIPLLVMVGRIDRQKGLDIAFVALREISGLDWQFILLGSGDPVLEQDALNLQTDFPDRIRMVIRFDEALSHLIYGGGDILLMPSRYEPCGLAQMIAMRYGCVPVVHSTGGLKDTVLEGTTGFLFPESTSSSLVGALERALAAYQNPSEWQRFQRHDMNEDFSWSRSASQYAYIYNSILSDDMNTIP